MKKTIIKKGIIYCRFCAIKVANKDLWKHLTKKHKGSDPAKVYQFQENYESVEITI